MTTMQYVLVGLIWLVVLGIWVAVWWRSRTSVDLVLEVWRGAEEAYIALHTGDPGADATPPRGVVTWPVAGGTEIRHLVVWDEARQGSATHFTFDPADGRFHPTPLD